jgi:photosystem II protein
MAEIQFARGVKEETIPDVRITRSRSGNQSVATFYFESPKAFSSESAEDITGMYLIDEEGEIVTKDVKGVFVQGQAKKIQAIYIMNSTEEWERFLRFMNRYAEENGLDLSRS